jgi:hypothetical protein
LELFGIRGNVIDDHIGHDVVGGGDLSDLGPGPKAGVHLAVVTRIEPSVGSVDGGEEGQDMNAGKCAIQLLCQKVLEPGEVPG